MEFGRLRRTGKLCWQQRCQVCDKEFLSHQPHAKTCSPACRQRLYRERKKVLRDGRKRKKAK
jgi:hypothetical protein